MSAQIPPVATWHGINGPCASCGAVHLSMDVEPGVSAVFENKHGPVLRLRLSLLTVKDLVEVLGEALAKGYGSGRLWCRVCDVQSDNSSGNPQVEVSRLPDGANVALAQSASKTCDGV